MPRMLRYQPEPWSVHFVTVRCTQSRYLLRPSEEVRLRCVGIIERAREHTGCRLHGAVVLSGHMHLLVSSESARHLADYMEFINGNIAREIGKLHEWQEHFWGRRYQAALCQDEDSQIDRLGYLLAHGEKEGLVSKAREWPGLHTIRATCDNEAIRGVWIDRTEMYIASQRSGGEAVDEADFRQPCTLTLHPLPCWEHLDHGGRTCQAKRAYLRVIAKLGSGPDARILGVEAVLATNPHDRPDKTNRSPAPLCHATTKAEREKFRKAYYSFVRAYREGMARLREDLAKKLDDYIPRGGIAPGGLRPAPS